jgi:6-phospho-beta-glucosidase
VEVSGEDVLPMLLRTRGDEIAAHVDLPRRIIDNLGAIPSYYLRYYYQHDLVVQELLESKSRAEEVMEVERQLLQLYRDPELHDKPELLMQRGGAYYSEAAITLLSSLFGENDDVQVVDVRNNGIIPELPADTVLEVPAHVGASGAVPLPVPALPPHQAGLIAHTAAYEALAASAAVTGDREVAFRALLTHPLIGQSALAEQLLTDLLAANRTYLPAFS